MMHDFTIIITIMIIIIKSSSDRDNNYCHYVIQRIAGFAIGYILSSVRTYFTPLQVDHL
jgi:hypothetical protein